MDINSFIENNKANALIESSVPHILTVEPCCMGIDEAGRGPVLGPMVYGCAVCPISKKDAVKELGVADSKTLTEEQREELFKKIDNANEYMSWKSHILSPTYICNSQLRRAKYNLNELSHDTAIGLIKQVLADGVNLTEVYLDTVGPPEKYQAKLQAIFPDLDITVAKKADSLYPIVSAASICAKVPRDKAISTWRFPEGLPEDTKYGSGYPSDPVTKQFMSECIDPLFGYPGLVRFSWSTAATLLEQRAHEVKWPDDDEEEENKKPKGVQSVSKYFQAKPEDNRKRKHGFFRERCLKQAKLVV